MDIEARMREVEREIISRRPEHSVDLALDRMAELVGLLGDPQRACPVIHITGTNGKTSTARMTDALLRSRGLRTGRFLNFDGKEHAKLLVAVAQLMGLSPTTMIGDRQTSAGPLAGLVG